MTQSQSSTGLKGRFGKVIEERKALSPTVTSVAVPDGLNDIQLTLSVVQVDQDPAPAPAPRRGPNLIQRFNRFLFISVPKMPARLTAYAVSGDYPAFNATGDWFWVVFFGVLGIFCSPVFVPWALMRFVYDHREKLSAILFGPDEPGGRP